MALSIVFFGCPARMTTMEKGDRNCGKRILIATERSEFKDAVVQKIVAKSEEEGWFVKATDLRELPEEPTAEYQAVAIVNTCKAGRLSRHVRKVLDVADEQARGKMILLTTAGDEDWQANVPGVDAITSASKEGKADAVAEIMIEKVNARLASP